MDANNFYVSCERVFQPAWEQRPVGVLSNNDGCLIARSNELKAAGIPMGAPYFQFRDQLRAMKAVIVSSNYALYGDMSARVMHTLGQFTPALEVYSIDEAWLDLTGFDPATVDAYSREIVATTRRHTGIPVSVGIGPTKVLAKVANRLCKQLKIPGQVFNLGGAGALEAVLATVPVGELWGIGPRWAEQLQQQGIHTALQLRNADVSAMRDRYNVVMARLILELRGVSCLEREDIAPKQQIIASGSFGERVTELSALIEAVSRQAARAGEKLRRQGSACGALQVSIRTGRHNPNERYVGRSAVIRFPVATTDTRQLIGAARIGVERIYTPGPRYAHAGVMLMDIVPAPGPPGDLVASGDCDQSVRLMKAVDQVNQRHGRRTVFFAGEGVHPGWLMKRERMTRAYTTRWPDIPPVH